MGTEGINKIAIIAGYRYFCFMFEILPIIIDKTNTDIIIRNTMPIASVGPANNGNI